MPTRFAVPAALLSAAVLGAGAAPALAAAHHAPGRGAHHARHAAHPGHRPAGARGPIHTMSFTARVVRSNRAGLVVRTLSGKVVSFAAAQVRTGRPHPAQVLRSAGAAHPVPMAHVALGRDVLTTGAGNIVLHLLGLQPGALVQITETTDAEGTTTITISLPATAAQPATVDGLVTEVDLDTLTLQTGDGSELRLHVAADTLAGLGLQPCDTATVAYHQDAGILVADTITPTGASASGDCAPSSDATGTITDVSAAGLTISTDGGAQTFVADPASGITDGYAAGDLVDVTYTVASDGTQVASDVEYVEGETTGTVTAVTTTAAGGSLTITDDTTGQSDVFTTDPANGVQIDARAFDGIHVGDGVDVTFHQSAGGLIADTVDQQ